MTKTEYRTARRLCRENGRYALNWMPKDRAAVMDELMFSHNEDWLAERADIVAYCRREGIACTVRHTGRRIG